MYKNSSVYVAGHRGLVGSAVVRELKHQGYSNIITVRREQADLKHQDEASKLFNILQPEYVFLCAAKVGGIEPNRRYPADFLRENLQIQTNIIDAAWRTGVKKLIFVGSSCAYPRDCSQPIKEEYLLTGPLEKTNEAYALAKIAGLKLCEFYRAQYGFDAVTVMPTNLYGPHDNFNPETAHVVPALIQKFFSYNNRIEVWGDGIARREFLHVGDLAKAMVLLARVPTEHDVYNIGSGEEVSIAGLADHLAVLTKFQGKITFNNKKPSGTPRKLLDSSRILELGWNPSISLRDGLRETLDWFEKNYTTARK